MTKVTKGDKMYALEIAAALINEYRNSPTMYVSDAIAQELERLENALKKRRENLLFPKPKRPAKPSSTATGIAGITPNAKLKGRG